MEENQSIDWFNNTNQKYVGYHTFEGSKWSIIRTFTFVNVGMINGIKYEERGTI